LPKQYTKISPDDIACNIGVDYAYLLHKSFRHLISLWIFLLLTLRGA